MSSSMLEEEQQAMQISTDDAAHEESVQRRLDTVFAGAEMLDKEEISSVAHHLQSCFSVEATADGESKNLPLASILAANHLRTISASGKGRQARRSLEAASQELLKSSTRCAYLAFTAVAMAMAVIVAPIDDGSDVSIAHNKEERSSSRASASAMAYVLQRQQKEKVPDESALSSARAVISSLLLVCSKTDKPDDFSVTVDWHIVTMVARAFQMDTRNNQEATLAVAAIMQQALRLDDEDQIPEKIQAAGALALVAQMKPWTSVKPIVTIKPAVMLDLWEAAERICLSAAEDDVVATAEAVQALIQEAFDAKTYRLADKLATKFYDCGGQAHYLEARYMHACDTIAKVIRKGVIPIIERQVERVDNAVKKVVDDGNLDSSTAADDIRSFALRQLEESGNMPAAHRLAGEWGLDYVHDEEALKAAAEIRRQKYIQWEDVLVTSPPELLSSPDTLISAFTAMAAGQKRFGFDAEWSEDSSGAEILQVATRHGAILIDVPALSKTLEGTQALAQTIGSIFADSSMEVIGFGCKQDISKLRSSPCKRNEHWLSGTDAVVDLQKLAERIEQSKKTLGLSRVCEKHLGKPLDKSEQCSLWSARPLSMRQRVYASLDAWACAALYEKLNPSAETGTTVRS